MHTQTADASRRQSSRRRARRTFGALTPGGYHAETFTGGYLDLSAPDPKDINLIDIAVGLSNACRGGGQLPHFSVAEHAVLVARRLAGQGHSPSVVLAGLHHDDPEGYIQDLIKPAKELVEASAIRWLTRLPFGRPRRSYGQLESQLWEAIQIALGLERCDIHDPAVKTADTWALDVESYYLRLSRGATWFCHGAYDPDRDPVTLRPARESAAGVWLREHRRLIAELAREGAPA